LSLLKKIDRINNLISDHEEKIANPILEYISKRKDFILIGKNKISNKNRAPTISFTVKNRKSSEISSILVKNKIATRNDNFYAWRCLKALNIDTEDGLVRLSMTHYNSIEDTNAVLKALEQI
jgi:selenocysteine lyase/cysteine desulfurase